MTEENPRISAGRAVVGKVVAEQLAAGNKAVRNTVEPLMEPGEKMKATLPGGMPIGTVQRTETSKVVRVYHDELLAWVKANRPDQIIEQVSETYVHHLQEICRKRGVAVDETTGEIIPGVELREGSSSFRITPSSEGREYILLKLRELADIGILDLPAGTTE